MVDLIFILLKWVSDDVEVLMELMRGNIGFVAKLVMKYVI
jgi:hypothetical protein